MVGRQATAPAFLSWRCIRSPTVFRPRSVSQQSNGEGTASVAFCRNLISSKRIFGRDCSQDQVGVFARALSDPQTVAATAAPARVLFRRRSALQSSALEAIAEMPYTGKGKLMGDSIHTCCVRGGPYPYRFMSRKPTFRPD